MEGRAHRAGVGRALALGRNDRQVEVSRPPQLFELARGLVRGVLQRQPLAERVAHRLATVVELQGVPRLQAAALREQGVGDICSHT